MEVASGSMILHPDLAREFRTLHESSSFESAGAFLKHLFSLEEQHRSQQCLTNLFTNVEQPWLSNYNAGQTASLDSAPKTASVGIQVKLCFCSDNIIERAFFEQGITSNSNPVQQDDLQDELSDSDYSDTEEVFEEADGPKGRNHKQQSERVGGTGHKTVGRPTQNRRKSNQGANQGYSCKDCGEKFTRECYLLHHMKKHRGEETTVQCKFCDLIFPSPWTLTSHIALTHPEHAPPPRDKPPKDPLTCKICGMALKTPFTYRQHQRTHTDERPYACNLCHKTFRVSSSLAKHKLGMHTQERPYPCHLCDKHFKHSSDLVRHQVVHTREKRYKCLECNKAYSAAGSLQFHNLRYHEKPGVKPCKCPHCGKCFVKKFTMNNHIKRKHLHPEQYERKPYTLRNPPLERSFQCELCSKAFRYSCNLRRHYITHTGEQRFKCTQCDKAYRDNCSLKNHVLQCHENPGVKPNKCSDCDKCFSKRSSLLVHFRKKHENPEQKRSLQCDICDKLCVSLSKLDRHYATHTKQAKQKPTFKCDICNKVCVSSSKLKRHVAFHKGEKEFKCPQCGKAYKYSDSLQNHIQTRHENPELKTHECPHCDRSFVRESPLTTHIKKMHDENREKKNGKDTAKSPAKYSLKIPAHVGMTRVVSQGFKSTAASQRAPVVLPVIPKSPDTNSE